MNTNKKTKNFATESTEDHREKQKERKDLKEKKTEELKSAWVKGKSFYPSYGTKKSCGLEAAATY